MSKAGVQLALPWCPCGYEGDMKVVLDPRPSTKKSIICPNCLEEVKP